MLNSSNRCDTCGAKVSNPDRRRRTIEQLTATHDETCPGRFRGTRQKRTSPDE